MKSNTHAWSVLSSALVCSLVVASLDGLAAVVSAGVQANVTPERVFQYIASALIGQSAFTGGLSSVALGVFLHWLIAFIWSWLFHLIYPKRPLNFIAKFLLAILIGLVVYIVMKYAVVPLSLITSKPGPPRIDQMLIHLFCVGLPISFFSAAFQQKRFAAVDSMAREEG